METTDKRGLFSFGQDDASGTWTLVRRLLALAWNYRIGCIRVVALQLVLLGLGMAGLGLTGLGVDYLRHEISRPTSGAASVMAPSAPAAPDGPVVTADRPTPRGPACAKPPRWPWGLKPPSTWTPMQILLAISSGILVMALLRSVLSMVYTIEINRLVQSRIVVDLRDRVYSKMQRLSFRFFDANASSAIINRVTGDVQSVRMFVDGVVMQILILILSLVVYLAYMLSIHPLLTLVCLITTPLLWTLTARFSRAVQPAYVKNREIFDRLILALSENLMGIHVVKAFGREQAEIEKYARINAEVRDQKRGIFRKVGFFQPMVGMLSHLNIVIMLAYGGYLAVCYERAPDPAAAAQVGISLGQLLVFAGLLQQFSGQVGNIGHIANSMQQSLAGSRRVFQILDAPIEIESPPNAIRLARARGAVSFERVTFGYRTNDPILRDISFEVEPGQCIAILGATGTGKSTLLSLVPRFYDPSAGRILVDGIDVRALHVNDLRRNIGIVFQESFLFSNTVAANIAFGKLDATREDIERASRIAAAHDFITQMPEGYQTVLHESGANLSGGQRQRIAIARAILLQPAILLLDDPTAAVDTETEKEILQAMDAAMDGRTTFIVTNRLSALRRADRIIVLNANRIVQDGTHEELIREKGQYQWAMSYQVPDAESCRLLGEEADFSS